jgi:hypothetical protein
MAVRARTDSERDAGHSEWRGLRRTIGTREEAAEKNIDVVVSLDDPVTIALRGVVLISDEPTSVPDALRVASILHHWSELSGRTGDQAYRQAREVFHDGTKLLAKLLRPQNVPRWFWRWRVRWRGNPFEHANEREFLELLSFLSGSRMR